MSRLRGIKVGKDESKRLEDEARLMEAKIQLLRKTMDETAPAPASGAGRWKSGSAAKPLTRGYVKEVLDTQGQKRKTNRTSSTGRRPVGSNVPSNTSPPGSQGARPQGTRSPPQDASRAASPARSPTGLSAALSSRPTQSAPNRVPEASVASPAKGRAAANIQAAIQQTSDEMREVEAFLAGLQLDRYVALFAEHGFDCMEVVQEMEESHMQEIGMVTGHIIKLKKKLAELNPPKSTPPPPAPAAAAPRAMADSSASTRRSVSFGDTEVRRPESSGQGAQSGRLIDGGFDEDESAESFQEALRAWREGRDTSDAPAKSQSPTVASYNEAAKKAATGSFWSTVGGGEMDLERASTPVTTPMETSKTDDGTNCDAAPGDEKLCCYNCYKQFFARFAKERESPLDGLARRFCTDRCADVWLANMQQRAEEHRKRMETISKMQEAQRAYEAEHRMAMASSMAKAGAGGC